MAYPTRISLHSLGTWHSNETSKINVSANSKLQLGGLHFVLWNM